MYRASQGSSLQKSKSSLPSQEKKSEERYRSQYRPAVPQQSSRVPLHSIHKSNSVTRRTENDKASDARRNSSTEIRYRDSLGGGETSLRNSEAVKYYQHMRERDRSHKNFDYKGLEKAHRGFKHRKDKKDLLAWRRESHDSGINNWQ